MQSLIEFILKTTTVWAIAILFMEFFRPDKKTFALYRFFLLISLVCTPVYFSLPSLKLHFENVYVFNDAVNIISSTADNIEAYTRGAYDFWKWVLISGSLIAFLKFAINISKLLKTIKNSNREIYKDRIFYRYNNNEAFTFMGYIFIGNNVPEEDIEVIVAHEMAHKKLLHSIDKVLLELVTIFMWYHPLLYIYSKKMNEIHEFQADSAVRKKFSLKHYADILLRHNMNTRVSFFNNFSNHSSQLKKRIIMMTNKNNKLSSFYYAALPFFFLLIWGLNIEKLKAQQNTQPEVPPVYGNCEGDNTESCTMQNIMADISKDIQYPQNAKENKIEGKVFVEFIISAEGKTEDVKVIKKLHPECDAESIRVVKNLNKWKPGKQNGKNTSVKMVLPIFFKLS